MYINLFPDMSRSQYTKNETFVYAAPVSETVWSFMLQRADTTPEGFHYVLPQAVDDEHDEEVLLILRTEQMTDADCLSAAAWVRLIFGVRCMCYCIPKRFGLSPADMIRYTTGAPRALCRMISVRNKPKEDETP